ncbi:hypothetical protein LCGC14_1804280, partial [marine sediment metagenome]
EARTRVACDEDVIRKSSTRSFPKGTDALIVGAGLFWTFEVEHVAQIPVQASPFSARHHPLRGAVVSALPTVLPGRGGSARRARDYD